MRPGRALLPRCGSDSDPAQQKPDFFTLSRPLLRRYTKIGLLRKLLRETSRERAEWILWLDADTLLEEMAFQIPFHAYRGKSFVAWGNADYLWAGDQFHGAWD